MKRINARTLHQAAVIYDDWFGDELSLSDDLRDDLYGCRTWADFTALQDDLSAGQWDAIEAAIIHS